MLCYNIVLNNRFYARILGSVEDAAYAEVQEQLFERLALCIENIFCAQKVTVHPFTKSREFCDTIKGLLDGQRPADDTVLRQNGWYTSNQYQIIVFRCSGFFPLEEGSQYLYRQLSNIFPEGCVLEKDQDFVCVRNLGNGLEDDGDFRERLAVFLREHVVKAGLGNVFAGTENFALYLSQAYDALRLGERKNPHFWSYNFESYAFDYLLGQCVCRYSPREVIAPELKKILEADREKGTDYYNTLRVYLESGCSASRSAEKLYIHRSSLMKRLGKIETFTGIDLENPDTRLYLLLSFKLLDYEK